MESSHFDIDLHLREINHLFVDPELNPLENQRMQTSGMEEAIHCIRTRESKVDKVNLRIFLPLGQIEPGLQGRVKDALSRYCDFKIRENQHELKIERASGRRAVMIGLIFTALCLVMIIAVYLLGSLDDALFVVFVGFFTILIWMAIWNPAETFLYGLQPYKQEIKAYEMLKKAEVVINEES